MSITIGSTIVFCLILLQSWNLVHSQDEFCTTSFDQATVSVEPTAIYSRDSNVSITIENSFSSAVAALEASFSDDNSKSIYCFKNALLWKLDQTLIFTCTTSAFRTFANNLTLHLNLKIDCVNSQYPVSRVYYPNTIVADPDIESIFPLKLIAKHTNRIFLNLKSIFPSLTASFDLDIGNDTLCGKEQNGKLVIFDCFFNNSLSNIIINMNGNFWVAREVKFTGKPEILQIVGSTFENASIPICFVGKNLDSFYNPILYTILSNESNVCNITRPSSMCCFTSLTLKPIDKVTFIEAQLYSHHHPVANVSLRQGLIPVLTFAEFSFKRNELTLKVQHFDTHYAPYTTVNIYDSARQFMVDCVAYEFTSQSIICHPKIKISLSGRLTHFLTLNISQWYTIYPRIDNFNEETFTSFQLIMLLIVGLLFVMLISWGCIIIYYGCCDSTEGIRIVPRSYFYRYRKEKPRNSEKEHRKRSHLHESRRNL